MNLELVVDNKTWKLLHFFDLVLHPHIGHESEIVNFMSKLLEKLKHNIGNRIIFT